MSRKMIKVDYLARVEGEGGLHIKLKDDRVVDVQLKIFEPPRFFEAFLRGRSFMEVPDITARICGICPVAYQMSSCHAMEAIAGVQVSGMLRELRRLLYCGEWIESHVLHTFMLHAPDFLGYPDSIQMAKDHPDLVKLALRLKKHGNDIMIRLAGREIHPINVRVGGFYRVPARQELLGLVDDLKWSRDAALEAIPVLAGLPFPEFEQDYEFVALRHPDEYPFNEGRLVSNIGLDIDIADYEQHFVEVHVAHSNALHSRLKKRDNYHVGPLARYNLNFDRLPDSVKKAAKAHKLEPPVTNPFKSIAVRGLETLFAVEEALRIIESYEPPDEPYVEVLPQAGTGHGCTEAPRGILYHRYTLDDDGLVQAAHIVPPTSQNQKTMENDLWRFVEQGIETDMEHDLLAHTCEQAIRNYDPCISCATHFLKLEFEQV